MAQSLTGDGTELCLWRRYYAVTFAFMDWSKPRWRWAGCNRRDRGECARWWANRKSPDFFSRAGAHQCFRKSFSPRELMPKTHRWQSMPKSASSCNSLSSNSSRTIRRALILLCFLLVPFCPPFESGGFAPVLVR